jgi:hypothetical protein
LLLVKCIKLLTSVGLAENSKGIPFVIPDDNMASGGFGTLYLRQNKRQGA